MLYSFIVITECGASSALQSFHLEVSELDAEVIPQYIEVKGSLDNSLDSLFQSFKGQVVRLKESIRLDSSKISF